MKTDELRRELHDAALQIEPFEGDVGRVRGRVRTRRFALAGAMVVALAIPAVVVATRSGGDSQDIALRSAKAVELYELEQRDALVVVPVGGDLTDVEAALEASDDVRNFVALQPGTATFLTSGSRMEFCKDAGSFVVDVIDDAGGTDQLARELGSAQVVPWQQNIATLRTGYESMLQRSAGVVDDELFMSVDASDVQIDEVRRALAADPDVAQVEYLDKEDAYAEFRRMFADQPELIASTTADALPASFRIGLRDGTDEDAFTTRYDTMPGVDDVLSSRQQCTSETDDVYPPGALGGE